MPDVVFSGQTTRWVRETHKYSGQTVLIQDVLIGCGRGLDDPWDTKIVEDNRPECYDRVRSDPDRERLKKKFIDFWSA